IPAQYERDHHKQEEQLGLVRQNEQQHEPNYDKKERPRRSPAEELLRCRGAFATGGPSNPSWLQCVVQAPCLVQADLGMKGGPSGTDRFGGAVSAHTPAIFLLLLLVRQASQFDKKFDPQRGEQPPVPAGAVYSQA